MKQVQGLRLRFTVIGSLLLAYFVLLYLAVFLCERVFSIDIGWGYLSAAAITLLILFRWSWTGCTLAQFSKCEKPMRGSAFLMFCCLLLTCQFFFQITSWIALSFFGGAANNMIHQATSSGNTLPMFIYVWVIAPVVEEVVFRGLAQGKLIDYGKGKCFGVLCSALIFGLFHVNPIQIPFAFLIGLVLGYVAAEYSVLWAVALHLVNNFVFGGLIGMLKPAWLEQLVYFALTWGGGLFGIWILVKNRKRLIGYWKCKPVEWSNFAVFITSPGMMLLLIVVMVSMIFVLF